MTNLLNDLLELKEETKVQEFGELEINTRAAADFRFLCSKTSLTVKNNVKLLAIFNSMSQKIADCLVVGYDTSWSEVIFPANLLDVNEKMYVTVVAYKNAAVQDVYLFEAKNFKKTGLFSMFKYDAKRGIYSIKMPSAEKLKQYSFGYVLKI